jgi:multicomponent Na+:H+ antiporter subunit B
MTGMWSKTAIPVFGAIGTPVIFDMGVYLVVLGVVLTIVFSLAEGD